MKTYLLAILSVLACRTALAQAPTNRFTAALANKENRINITVKEAEQRVDVTIDGRPFTSYIWGSAVTKPALFPILTPKGNPITRGYPVAPRPSERVENPNQVGLFMGYANINGIDFWNDAQNPSSVAGAQYGKIVHKAVNSHLSGKVAGHFEVENTWIGPDGSPLISETSRFTIEGNGTERSITRTVLFKALKQVTFKDDAQGFLAVRLGRELEHKSKIPALLTGPDGKPMAAPSMGGVPTGEYINSESLKLDSIYGKRAEWLLLNGQIINEPLTVMMFDYPKNAGFPSYWSSTTTGLLAVNPFAHAVFSKGMEELNLKLAKGETISLKYMLRIQSGRQLAESDGERIFANFSKGEDE